jgi:hypothetical protein
LTHVFLSNKTGNEAGAMKMIKLELSTYIIPAGLSGASRINPAVCFTADSTGSYLAGRFVLLF